MPDAPYTREEIEKCGSSLPTRGRLCGKCGAHIPQFSELSEKDARRICAKALHGQPILASIELRGLTGCPESWVQIWFQHEGGFLRGNQKNPRCSSPNRRGRKWYEIDEILGGSDAVFDLADVLRSAAEPLNAAETNLLIAFEAWGGIECEGLDTWLFNNQSRRQIEEAATAFRAVGAPHFAAVMQKVLDLARSPATAADLDSLSEVVNQDGTRERLRALETELEGDDVEALLYAYIRKHIKKFK